MPSKKRKNQRGTQPTRQTGASDASIALPEDEAAAAARREEQRREWAERKRAKERKPIPVALYAWLVGGGAAVIGCIVLVVLLLSGGGDGSSPAATARPDPRVAGLPVDQTEEIIATDQGQNVNPRFSKTTIVGKAGDVIEITVRNDGTVTHNLAVAGEDGEYGSSDDWITQPESIPAGETGVVKVKIDVPGTYPFQCDFHPQQQRGNLVLS